MAHIIASPASAPRTPPALRSARSIAFTRPKTKPTFADAEMLYIDPDTCIDCGLCVDECPVTAIFPQEDLPAEWAEFIEKNTAYYKK